MENYTFEDYLKDFELDYLGFDGIPDSHTTDCRSEQNTESEFEPDGDGTDEAQSRSMDISYHSQQS